MLRNYFFAGECLMLHPCQGGKMWQPCEVGKCATLFDTKACDKKLDITINVAQMVTKLLKSVDTSNALLFNQGEALYCPL
jgi:hypothetical protein